MARPQFSIRAFLLLCLLFGAVGIPWAWKGQQKRKADEIEQLKAGLSAMWASEPTRYVVTSPTNLSSRTRNPEHVSWQRRVELILNRLEKLTGKRPTRPDYESYEYGYEERIPPESPH